jgi:hypothetical protein
MTTGLDDAGWVDNGDKLNTVGDGISVGGYTASPTASEGAIVIANDEHTIYHGLLFDCYDGDQDADGKLDIIELIENEILFLCGECTEDNSGQLDIVGKAGGPGTTVTVPVRIQDAPNEVDSLGFDVTYNTDILNYVGYSDGECVTGFDFFEVNEVSPGLVRVGGFEAGGDTIAQGESCVVVNLEFTVISCDQGRIYPLGELRALVDDLAGWTASGACFQCGCSCDVNGDGEVTPVDALCAFQKYLGICPTSCGLCEEICCDVTVDDDCTPADALEIFKEYLGLPSICSD